MIHASFVTLPFFLSFSFFRDALRFRSTLFRARKYPHDRWKICRKTQTAEGRKGRKHREAIEIIRNLFEHINTFPSRCSSTSAENIPAIGFSVSSTGIFPWLVMSRIFNQGSLGPLATENAAVNAAFVNRICCRIKYHRSFFPLPRNRHKGA